jgi:hypothetical protein
MLQARSQVDQVWMAHPSRNPSLGRRQGMMAMAKGRRMRVLGYLRGPPASPRARRRRMIQRPTPSEARANANANRRYLLDAATTRETYTRRGFSSRRPSINHLFTTLLQLSFLPRTPPVNRTPRPHLSFFLPINPIISRTGLRSSGLYSIRLVLTR